MHAHWQAVDTKYPLNQIIRCEAVNYTTSWLRGVTAPGVEFPSSVIGVRGNCGIRLDLSDGLHLLIGTSHADRLAGLIRGLKSHAA